MGNLNFYILCIIILYLLYVMVSRIRKRMKLKKSDLPPLGKSRRKRAVAGDSSNWHDTAIYDHNPGRAHHNHHHSSHGDDHCGDSGDSGDSGGDSGGDSD
ncbi:hypothetical protein ASG89_20385 [Paenibacillus sp. Soil766]|nr:hypothetical protein ASG89_20385 [Paenibacillus sp. Soil766]